MSLIDVVILVGLVQGTMLLLGLMLKNWGKKNQNYFFIFLIGGICLALLSRLLFSEERYSAYPQIWFLADAMAYMIGPLWYLTIRRSTEPKVRFSWRELFLMLPALYHLIFLVRIFLMTRESFLLYSEAAGFELGFYWFTITAVIVNGGFLFLSQRFLIRFKDSSFPPLLVHGQKAMLLVTGFWLASFLIGIGPSRFEIVKGYDMAFVLLALCTLSLGMLAIIKPASFYFLTQTYDASEALVLQEIANKAKEYIDQNQSYKESDFQLNELAKNIGYNAVLTSKAINRCMKSNFNDMLNEYRINHFLELANSEASKQLTHWALAQESGFGNKVSFYNAFKKLKGTTPKNYLAGSGA